MTFDLEDSPRIPGQTQCSNVRVIGKGSLDTRIIQVPDEYVGIVIGRNRVRLREISEESEAKINTRCDEEDAPGTKAFKLIGNTEAVGKASQIIKQIIQGAREKGGEKDNQWQGNGWQYRTNNYW